MDDIMKGIENVKVTMEDISSLLSDYQIGKKPLSKLLGWGETTILRYLDGEIPTGEYAKRLFSLRNDPTIYYELLITNQENITGVAFRKSKKAVLLKLLNNKINLAAQYLVNLSDMEVTPVRVQIILFYAQSLSLVFTGKVIFQEECRITKEKIVYSTLYETMRQRGCRLFELPENSLSKIDKKILGLVFDALEWHASKPLRILFEADCNRLTAGKEVANSQLISKSTIQRYYRKTFEQYLCKNPEGFSDFIKKRMAALIKVNSNI